MLPFTASEKPVDALNNSGFEVLIEAFISILRLYCIVLYYIVAAGAFRRKGTGQIRSLPGMDFAGQRQEPKAFCLGLW